VEGESSWPRLEDVRAQDDRRLVILDDNLSGISTVYDTNILLDYSVGAIEDMLMSSEESFFIITNIRSLPEKEASRVIKKIMDNITQVVMRNRYAKPVQIVSRMDSTLRCHYPAVVSTVQRNVFVGCDSIILAPQVFEGGRVTFNDIHYIENLESDEFIPVHMTSYAQDSDFSYGTSHLKEWVIEKSKRSSNKGMDPERVISISLHDIREGGALAVQNKLENAPMHSTVVVNALHDHDMDVFMMGLLLAEQNGSQFIYSVGSSFVSSRMGLARRPPLSTSKLRQMTAGGRGRRAGLLVVDRGTQHVAEQIDHLVERTEAEHVHVVELEAARILWAAPRALEALRTELTQGMDEALEAGRHVVLAVAPVGSPVEALEGSTSADKGEDSGADKGNLAQSTVLTHFVSSVIQGLREPPSFTLTTGGGTAFHVAAHGCGITRGRVLGQIMNGVSIWRAGDDSAMPGVHNVTFPDNVTGVNTLTRVAEKLGVAVSDTPVKPKKLMHLYERILQVATLTSSVASNKDDSGGDLTAGGLGPSLSLEAEPPYLRRIFDASTLSAPVLVGFDVESLEMARAVVGAAAALEVETDVLLRFVSEESDSAAVAESEISLVALAMGLHETTGCTLYTTVYAGSEADAAATARRVAGTDGVAFDVAHKDPPAADSNEQGTWADAETEPMPRGVIAEGRLTLVSPFTQLPGGLTKAELSPLLTVPDVLEVELCVEEARRAPTDAEVDALCERLMELASTAPHRPIALYVPSITVGRALVKMLAERPRAPVISRIHYSAKVLAEAALTRLQRELSDDNDKDQTRAPVSYARLTGASFDAMREAARDALRALRRRLPTDDASK